MYEALTYQIMLDTISENARRRGILNDTIGILITRPDLPIGKTILDSLEYFHFRTGKSLNFYLPGYGAYWPKSEYSDGKVVTIIDGVNWSFSNQMFVRFVSELENCSKWSYSGESELLLVELKNGEITFENVIQFWLDNMLRDNVIKSIYSFLEQLFRVCSDKDKIDQISNALGNDKFKQITQEKILEKMPLDMGNIFTQEKYFCVKNMQL